MKFNFVFDELLYKSYLHDFDSKTYLYHYKQLRASHQSKIFELDVLFFTIVVLSILGFNCGRKR